MNNVSMNYGNDMEREQIVSRAMAARTLPEIEAAAQAIQEWMRAHPNDLNIEDALEPLAMLWEGLQTEVEKCPPVATLR